MRDPIDSGSPDSLASPLSQAEGWVGEGPVRAEHDEVLDVILFQKGDCRDELVFELRQGQLHRIEARS